MDAKIRQNQISTFISPATYQGGVVIPQLKPAADYLKNVYVIFVENTVDHKLIRAEKDSKSKKAVKDLLQSLQGSLADVKEFKGKTSVEVQHYITKHLW